MEEEHLTKEIVVEDDSEYNVYVSENEQEECYINDENDDDIDSTHIDADEYGSEHEVEEELNLHLSEESCQASLDYDILDYSHENALQFGTKASQLSEHEKIECSDKEHSYDESVSSCHEEHSSYEEFTSQDEVEEIPQSAQCDLDYKMYEIMTVDNNESIEKSDDTQHSQDPNYSNRIITDTMDKAQSASNDLDLKIQKNPQDGFVNRKSEIDKLQVDTSPVRRIRFEEAANEGENVNMKPDIKTISNIEQASDYEVLKTTDIFESHLKKAEERQRKIELKMQTILKTLTVLNVRNMAKHMSTEVANLHEYMYGMYNSKHHEDTVDVMNPDAFVPEQSFSNYNSMLSEIQNFNTNQETAPSRQKYHNKYFGAGSSAYQMHPKVVPQALFPPLNVKDAKSIKEASKQFNTQLQLLERTMDSDATESSSSDESGYDEGYNNEYQRQMPLSKRTSTQLLKLESSYNSRMRWIQLHVAFLEIRKKYHDYIHTVLQNLKSQVKFIDNDTKESMVVTNTTMDSEAKFSCARIRPLDVSTFKKRRLVQTANLHTVSMSAAQTSTLRCGCQWPYGPCALCTGRVDPTAPRIPNDCLDLQNKLALLDPGIHPNLSALSEVHQNVHFNAIMKMPEWQAKMIRCGPRIKTLLAATSAADRRMLKEELKQDRPRKFIKKPGPGISTTAMKSIKHGFKKRGRKPSSSKSAKRRRITDFDDHYDSSLSTNMSEESQSIATGWAKDTVRADRPAQRSTSFDIDNMVIPYGVPVTTKVQVLPYKEIITPKWRVVDYEPLLDNETVDDNNSNFDESRIRTSSYSVESDEDISDETALKRHMRCLLEERKKFGVYTKLSWTTRSRANRRLESKTMDMMPVTPQSEHTSESELPHSMSEIVESMDNTDINMEPTPEYISTLERINKRKSLQNINQISKDLGSDADTVSEINILPFALRQFPLTDEDYENMVSMMPAKHTEILNIMQSSGADELLRQSLTESDQIDLNVTSPFNEVIIKKEKKVGEAIGQFTMSDSEESVTMDDPDDPEWG